MHIVKKVDRASRFQTLDGAVSISHNAYTILKCIQFFSLQLWVKLRDKLGFLAFGLPRYVVPSITFQTFFVQVLKI